MKYGKSALQVLTSGVRRARGRLKQLARLRPLCRRTVVYHLRSYVPVLLVAATATAIITGALLVGDSVRGSLAARVEERLGAVDDVLIAPHFFRRGLAREIADSGARTTVPGILLTGVIRHAESDARAGDVNILGVPPAFWDFWNGPGKVPAGLKAEWSGRKATINAWLANAIGASAGDTILLYLQKKGEIPAESAFGRRAEPPPALRLEVDRVLSDEGLALFDMRNVQRTARNVFVPLEVLERTLKKHDLANAILVSASSARVPSSSRSGDRGAERPHELEEALRRVWRPEDAGLRIRVDVHRGYVSVESSALLLSPQVAEAVRRGAHSAGAQSVDVLTYLANTIAVGEREIPYSTITGVRSIGDLVIKPGEIVLNDWAAEDLGATPGDSGRITYYEVGPDHTLTEKDAIFKLRAVIPNSGVAADPGWTPAYPGISDSKGLRDWEPPFPIDLERIRDKDEEYWDEHRTTPKAFVSIVDAQRLWSSRFGDLTALRLRPDAALPSQGPERENALQEMARSFEKGLLEELEPRTVGLQFRAVKAAGLKAARGGTDFSTLFVGFSFFLIVSALVLLAMTFRLACEARAHELGVLAAMGYSAGTLRLLLLLDGAVLVGCGSLVGAAGGLGYGAALMAGLRSWWKDAVNAPFLALHPTWASLTIGPLATALLALLTIYIVSRRVAAIPPRRLLAGGGLATSPRHVASKMSLWISACAALSAAVLLLAGSFSSGGSPAAAFFGGGACLLVAGIFFLNFKFRRLASGLHGSGRAVALSRMAVSYAGRAPTRSLLTVILLAAAAFIIVTVAASRRDPSTDMPLKESGNGGFTFLGHTGIPLTASLGTAEGCEELHLDSETWQILKQTKTYPFRLRPGDDSSCLNLLRPQSPRVLGAPPKFIERGGFSWSDSLAETEEERANPWLLLEKRFEDDAVPAVGDANTVRWILHSGLGQDIAVTDDRGKEVKLRLVGLLSHSIFQGELVISEGRFLEFFPGVTGDSFFLFETPSRRNAPRGDSIGLARRLERALADYGFDAETTGERLASYQAVENTYLSTFQLLGGLGLLLGTVGLGAVLLRNVNERRGELALLRAVGYPRAAIAWIIVTETTFLLVLGLVLGAGSAVVAVLAQALGSVTTISWSGLAGTLAAIFAAGLGSSLLALRVALRAPLIRALRAD